MLVARVDLAPAHRQRPPRRADGAEALAPPLWLLAPAFVVAGTFSMSWNLGFQQTIFGVVVAVAPPVIAAVAASSWRAAYILAAVGPLAGTALLATLSPRVARSRETSALPPAAP